MATLKPDEGSLNIYLVVIEMVNCEEFCQVFQELGVKHIVSFTRKKGKALHEDP